MLQSELLQYYRPMHGVLSRIRFLLALHGNLPWSQVRELCGLCAMRFGPLRDLCNTLRARGYSQHISRVENQKAGQPAILG